MNIHEVYAEEKSCLGDPHAGEIDPNCLYVIADAAKISKAKNILEIGFNRGASCLAWLLFSDANIISIDVVENFKSVEYLKIMWENRFRFVKMDSGNLPAMKEWVGFFDLAFVDGRHDWAGISGDVSNVLQLKIPFVLFDDYFSRGDGPTIQEAIKQYQDRLVCLREYKGLIGQGLYFALPELGT